METESVEISTPKQTIPVKEQQPVSILTKHKTNVDAEMASQETTIKKAKIQVHFVIEQVKPSTLKNLMQSFTKLRLSATLRKIY